MGVFQAVQAVARAVRPDGLRQGQLAAAQALPFDHHETVGNLLLGECRQNLPNSREHLRVTPIAVPEEDYAWFALSRQRQEPEAVEIGGDHSSAVSLCAVDDRSIGCIVETQIFQRARRRVRRT